MKYSTIPEEPELIQALGTTDGTQIDTENSPRDPLLKATQLNQKPKKPYPRKKSNQRKHN
jgi:hypothetical protein